MTNILNVSYVSQLGTGASQHNNDCGAASSLMLLRTYNVANTVTVDQFYDSANPGGDTALAAWQLQIGMTKYNLQTKWSDGMTLAGAFDALRYRKPFIALIHYGVLVDAGLTQFTGFKGAHFLAVTGTDLDYTYINDPYRSDGKINVPVPNATFETAWNSCGQDNNPNGGAIIPTVPIQDLSAIVVNNKYTFGVDESNRPVNGLNVRKEANGTSAIVKVLYRTNTPVIYTTGLPQNKYIQLLDKSGWVYYPYLKPLV